MPISVNDWNQRSFSSTENGTAHSADAGIFPAERAMFDGLPPTVFSGDVLDLGVGTGRTIPFLRSAARYVGIDYSAVSIEEARRRFPGTDLRTMDARDLSAFGDASFDLVFFGYNGIDYVDHRGRLAIISEISRVLRQGGCFAFSFHNRDFSGLEAARKLHRVNWLNHPVGLVRSILRVRQARSRRLAAAAAETTTPDYAIVNDCGMNFGLLTYCTTAPVQACQLADAGFTDIAAYDLGGSRRPLEDGFKADNMIHMTARKP